MLRKLYAGGKIFAAEVLPALVKRISPDTKDRAKVLGYMAVVGGIGSVATNGALAILTVGKLAGAALGIGAASGKALAISGLLAPFFTGKVIFGAGVVAGGEKNCGLLKRIGNSIRAMKKSPEIYGSADFDPPVPDDIRPSLTRSISRDFEKVNPDDLEHIVRASRGIIIEIKPYKPKQ